MRQKEPASSLWFQIFVHYDSYFSIVYFVASFFIVLYKSYTLIYSGSALAGELIILLIYAVLQFTRLYMGSVGNKTENVNWLVGFLLM